MTSILMINIFLFQTTLTLLVVGYLYHRHKVKEVLKRELECEEIKNMNVEMQEVVEQQTILINTMKEQYSENFYG